MFPATGPQAGAVVAAFRGIAGRLVAVSSIDVYRAYDRLRRADPGPPDPVPLTEESPLRARLFPYRDGLPPLADDPLGRGGDYDKMPAERAVLGEPQLPGTILRLPMVYGPGDYQHRLFPYLRRMDDGRPAILLDERRAHWRGARGYVEDVPAAIVAAVESGRVTGVEARRPPERGWPRALAFLRALALLSAPALGLATMLGPDLPFYSDGPVVEGARMLLLAVPFGFAGALLLRRLIAPRRASPASGR